MDALVRWSVYRSLDTRTNARHDLTGLTAGERLARWREAEATDGDILDELRRIYEYNPSRRGAGEPIVVVKSDYPVTRRGETTKWPALWCSLDNNDITHRYNKKTDDWDMTKPTIVGIAIVDVVRALMNEDSAPPMPRNAGSP